MLKMKTILCDSICIYTKCCRYLPILIHKQVKKIELLRLFLCVLNYKPLPNVNCHFLK